MELLKKIKTILERRRRYKAFIKKLKCPTSSFKGVFREDLKGFKFIVEIMYINKAIVNLYITAMKDDSIISLYCKNFIYTTKSLNKSIYESYDKIVNDCLNLDEIDIDILKNNSNIWSFKGEHSYIKNVFYSFTTNKIAEYLIKYENIYNISTNNEDHKLLNGKRTLDTLMFKNKTFINSINIPYCQVEENNNTLKYNESSSTLSYKVSGSFISIQVKDSEIDGPHPRTMRYIALNGNLIDYSSVLLEIPIYKDDKKILLFVLIDYIKKEVSFEQFKYNIKNNEYIRESSKEIDFNNHQQEIIELMEYTTLKYFANYEIIKDLGLEVLNNELTDEQISLLRMYSI